MSTTNTDTETGWTSDLVSREAVNKILYDGYQAHLHHCTNSVNAAQFVHDLQKAVTALPSPDFEQLTRLREAAHEAVAVLDLTIVNESKSTCGLAFQQYENFDKQLASLRKAANKLREALTQRATGGES